MSMATETLLTGEGGLWLMPSSQGRGAYQVHLCDDYDGGEDEDDDDCGVGAGGKEISSSPSFQVTFTLMMGKTGPLALTGEST